MSETIEVDHLREGVEQAVNQIHELFRGYPERAETLDRFWRLQDLLYRLSDAINNSSATAVQYQGLTRKIVDVLRSTEVFSLSCSIPAVKCSCASINATLLGMEHEKEQGRAAVVAF